MPISVKGVSLFSLLVTSCGAVDIPDSLDHRGNRNGDATAGSSESKFDLSRCGFDLAKSASTISSRRMAMVPKNMTVTTTLLGGLFTTQTNVAISGLSIDEQSLTRNIFTFTAQATPAVDSEEVQSIISNLNSGLTADLVTPADRAKIGETYSDWKGVFCSFQPAKKIERGSTEKVVTELDKPLPLSPLLIADVGRLKAEMGVKRSWTGITAKVVDSSDPEVQVGSSWTGRAFSSPVAASVQVDGPSGKLNIASDLAVKLTYDFGGARINAAIGLPSSVTWYIDDATNSLKLTQVDFGDGVMVNYLPDR
jgi:hypothetical protein